MKTMHTRAMLAGLALVFCALPALAAPEGTLQGKQERQLSSQLPPEQSVQGQGQETFSFSQKLPEWKARWELARLLSYTQRYDASIAEYEKVLEAKPDRTQAKLEMAKVLAWNGQQEKAQNILESFSQDALDPESRIELADIYAAKEDYDRAISIYTTYLSDYPDQDRVRLKLAQTLSWAGEYEASLKHYEQLIDTHPNDIQLRRQYAQVLTWAERYEQAIQQYRTSLQDK
ncbi:MAG: tetratricopeptide repeat protein [Desulfohalobium sp.]